MTVYLDKNMIDLSGRISSTYKLTGPASKLYMRVMASLALLSTLSWPMRRMSWNHRHDYSTALQRQLNFAPFTQSRRTCLPRGGNRTHEWSPLAWLMSTACHV